MTDLLQDETLELLEELKQKIADQELAAYILPHDDEYLSHDLTPDCERVATLCKFTGSAAFVCVTLQDITEPLEVASLKDERQKLSLTTPQAIFTDGRYQVQVREQVDTEVYDCFNLTEVSIANYLKTMLPKKSKVGIDLHCVSYEFYQDLKQQLQANNIELCSIEENLFDEVWEDRPEPKCTPVEIFPDEYNGCPSMQKRKNLAKDLRSKGLDATILTSPESICWLLNIRGKDRQHLPVINCRLVAYANEAMEWYINPDHLKSEDDGDDIQANLEEHIGHIDIFPENSFGDVLERLSSSKCSVYVDPKATNAYILDKLYTGGAKVIEGTGLCELPKAIKNPTELAGEHNAHVKDGVAMCRFLAWLDDITKVDNLNDLEAYARRIADLNESNLAEKVEYFRKIEGGYRESSFDTISALGPNAAMCHYNHLESEEPRKLGLDPLYLIDSGAHFFEGTTDITRTILVGPELHEDMQKMYTLVLKAHIALASTVFPRGTSGMQLDAIARRPLWAYGCDYDHGTGHGVGHLLSVHEGPHNISSKSSTVPLEVGMIVSIEPGYYEAEEYGIRLENLYEVTTCTQQGCQNMLCFEPLTLVPFDNRLIIREMLSQAERAWLNDYHQNTLTIIKNNASTISELELTYLARACAAI